jgi:hypothetical protein
MSACDLRPKVEQAIARVDLPTPERMPVRLGDVHTRLATGRHAIAGRSDEPTLTLAEQARWIRERRDFAA